MLDVAKSVNTNPGDTEQVLAACALAGTAVRTAGVVPGTTVLDMLVQT